MSATVLLTDKLYHNEHHSLRPTQEPSVGQIVISKTSKMGQKYDSQSNDV